MLASLEHVAVELRTKVSIAEVDFFVKIILNAKCKKIVLPL